MVDETPEDGQTPDEATPAEATPEAEETPAQPSLTDADAPITDFSPVTDTVPAEEAEPEVTDESLAAELTLGDAPVEETIDPNYKPVIRGKVDRFGVALGTGRRKTSVARVRLRDGNGDISINDGRRLEDYFPLERDREYIMAPIRACEMEGSVDVWVRVNGGGTTGQAGAVVLGVARALQARNPDFHHTLAAGGYLTRDSRMVERKKYGFKKARKSFQFSKR